MASIVTENFFSNMINIMDRKIHLHHSHLTGQIYGYLHSFSNLKVRGNKYFLRLFAQNLLELDLFFAVKGIKLCVSRTKNLSISGSNLTNINYTNISDQVKFTDIMKYYQQSLVNLAEIITEEEKFLKSHNYFKFVCTSPNEENKNEILDYLSLGKGVILYEKIRDFVSLNIAFNNDKFFEKGEFFSELKNKVISDEEYEDAKLLYQTLKMKYVANMKNLHNFQDVLILCKIFEERATFLYETYSFNPQRCNSASTLSGCIFPKLLSYSKNF